MNTDLHRWDRKEFARALAYLPQTPPPADGSLVREFTALGRYPWHGAPGRPGPEDIRAIAEAIEACHLEELADRQVETLSGGEAQRMVINADRAEIEVPAAR